MTTVAVIGLGYVGLPLVVEFGKRLRTIGFDIALNKVAACRRGTDPSRELPDEALAEARHAVYTSDGAMLAEADINRIIMGRCETPMAFELGQAVGIRMFQGWHVDALLRAMMPATPTGR